MRDAGYPGNIRHHVPVTDTFLGFEKNTSKKRNMVKQAGTSAGTSEHDRAVRVYLKNIRKTCATVKLPI